MLPLNGIISFDDAMISHTKPSSTKEGAEKMHDKVRILTFKYQTQEYCKLNKTSQQMKNNYLFGFICKCWWSDIAKWHVAMRKGEINF